MVQHAFACVDRYHTHTVTPALVAGDQGCEPQGMRQNQRLLHGTESEMLGPRDKHGDDNAWCATPPEAQAGQPWLKSGVTNK